MSDMSKGNELRSERLILGRQTLEFWPVGLALDDSGDPVVVGYRDRITDIHTYVIGDTVAEGERTAPLGAIKSGDTYIVFTYLYPKEIENGERNEIR